ncbi:Ig-like domain-containing protein [Gammaproteobacteria bacterium]|nr:Ig-like domain-containing protein [Gammaproteobacteria bacterium]MDA9800294.1 Ig-like domain-containing protein [Gammaproteobacteria bacterium]
MNKSSLYILTLAFIFTSCGGGGGGSNSGPAPVPFSLSIGLTSFATDEDTVYSGSLNATVNEPVTLTYAITSLTSNGQLTLSSNGGISYNPNTDFFGSDEFQYSVNAVEKNVTKSATVNITVNAINDEPTISITQLTSHDNTDYPLFISDSGLLEVSLALNDVDNANSSLELVASSTQGDILLTYDSAQSTSSATLDLSQIDLAGKIDILFTVSDGEKSASDTMKFWYAKEIITDNNDVAYVLFGNQTNTSRKINKVIALDSLASDEIIQAARSGLKSFVSFIGENDLDQLINKFMNILVVETPKGDTSILGVEIDCVDSVDPDTYCMDYDTYEFIYDYLENYFFDVDEVSIITGIDGRGTAYPGIKISFQPLLDSDIRSIRGLVLTLKHEFGHTFSILGDEYTDDFENGDVDCLKDDDDDNNDYSCGDIDLTPNTSSEQTPEELRWKHHIVDIDNVNGFDNTISTDGIGMYEGAYEGTDDVYRGSYASVMNGGTGSGYRDYYDLGISSKGVQWDEIGQEAFAIQTLKFQGLHGMSADDDDDGNIIVTQNLDVSEADFHIDWYIDGELDSSKRNSKSITLEKKISGWSTAGIRVSEVIPKFLKVTDDIYTFADAYRGIFSLNDYGVLCSSYGIEAYSSIEGYDEPLCRRTIYLVLDSGSSFWYHYDNFEEMSQNSDISYFYETSALGELFGIDWSNQ